MRITFNRIIQIAVILSIIVTFYTIHLNYKYPYVGAGVKVTSDNEMLINVIEPKTWAEKVGIHLNDVVLEINNEDPLLHSPAIKYGILEQVYDLKVLQNGTIKEFEIPTSLISYQSLFIIIIPLTVLFLCLFCIFFVYRTNKGVNLRSAHFLNLFLLIIGMAYISASGSSRGDSISRYINLTLFLLVPVSYLHFIYQYFQELGKKLFSFNFLRIGYLLVIINFVSEIVQNMLIVNNFDFNRILNLCSFLFLLVLTFVLKFTGLKKIKYSEQAYIVKILIMTNVIAFTPFLLFYVIPYVIFQKYIFSATFLAAFLLLIPFSLVYQFLATKIYDIDFLLGRIRYYSLLAVIPSFIIVGIMLLLKENNPTFYPIRLSVYIYLVIVLIFYSKEILDFRFRFKRFSEKYNYQDSIFKYTQSIRKASNLEHVVSELKQVILDVLLVSKAYFIEVDREKNLTSVDLNAKEADYSPYIKQIRDVTDEIGKIIEVDRGFVINTGETENKSYVLLCLSILNTPRLTRDEISWLKTLSFYTNVSLENFLKIDELMQHMQKLETEGHNPGWLTKLLFSIEEKQRSNLAKDLHDSVLQDLVSLKRQCELALVEVDADSSQLKKKLQEMNSSMTKIIKTTRETCQELRPQLLYDLGLVKALNKLVMQYQEYVDFDIRINTGNFTITLDIDTQLNIYRIVQELLTNAHKHSKASQVLIILVCIKEKIVLHYEDNGVGFEYRDFYDKTESMGLSGISERVKALKGSITINTSKGNGLKIDVEI
ncbi:sensor histidine kinase [Metabacillus sediminilitoris]|uniref:histidine kinase n=2 Tax=Metabacillus sediminilitoris TaxID=2567941 RepID=A0A4S4C0B9_9BACI|nr:sensor histidine kinase [Metabacillus sediminilitoris]QGQ47840.1 histidine kinase [Metabacillus sediminilitoris]THF81047.1 sensor histidine kinase [Metabacillus sediminilitoris]